MARPRLHISDQDRSAIAPAQSTSWFFVNWYLAAMLGVSRFFYHVLFWMLSSPLGVSITLFVANTLRRIHPVVRTGGMAIPMRAADMRDMLGRTDDFNAAEAMCPRLPAGQVVLAIDWPRRHGEERARLEEVLDHAPIADDARIRKIVRIRCKADLPVTGCIKGRNLARLCEDVALDVAETYLGVGVGRGNPRERNLLRPIIRCLAARVFQGPVPGSSEEIDALIASDRMQSLAKSCLEQQRQALDAAHAADTPIAPEDMTVLQRMIALRNNACPHVPAALKLQPRVYPTLPPADWFDDDWIIRNITTLTVFGSVTSARAMTQAIPQLMKTTERWQAGIDAAAGYAKLAPETYVHAHATPKQRFEMSAQRFVLLKIVFEAMRWHPMLSMLGIRTALHDTVLSPETKEKTKVTAGTGVLPLLLGAMHDPEGFPEPHAFRPEKREALDYLHFGAGPHECVGRRMAEIQMEEIAYALFSHPCVTRTACKTRTAGKTRQGCGSGNGPHNCTRIDYDGPAVIRLRFK